MKKYIILLISIILLSGCSYKELNELAIGDAIGIDYIDGQYLITVQILNLKKESGEQTSESSILYEATGNTIPTTIKNISLKYPKILYLGHTELMIVGKGALENGIEKTFDYLIRSPEARNDVVFLINPNGTAKEVLNPDIDKTQSFPSKEIISMVDSSMNRQGSTLNINFEEFVSDYLKKGLTPVTTGIILENNEYKLTKILAIKDNKAIELSKEQAIAYNILNNNFYDVILSTNYKDTILDIDVGTPKNDIKIDIKDNKITININSTLQSQIAEVNKKVNLEDVKVQKEIEKSINKTITNYFNSLIDFCKENDADILGFESMIYKHHYKDYEKFKDDNICEIAKFNVNAKVKFYRYGNIYKGTVGE